jgi:hypothetical protein
MAEIADTEEWMRIQASAGRDYATLCGAAAKQLAVKITHCQDLNTKSCSSLGKAILENAWTEGHRQSLTETIAHRELAGWRPNSQRRFPRVPQECKSFELYIPASLWRIIEDLTSPMIAKIGGVRKLCDLLRLEVIDQPTKGRIAQILKLKGIADADQMPPAEWQRHLEKVRTALATKPPRGIRGQERFAHIAQYPLDPRELPAELLAHAYAEGDGPAMREVLELGVVPPCLRKNANFFRTPSLEFVPYRVPRAPPAAEATEQMRDMFTMFSNMFGSHVRPGASRDGEIAIDVNANYSMPRGCQQLATPIRSARGGALPGFSPPSARRDEMASPFHRDEMASPFHRATSEAALPKAESPINGKLKTSQIAIFETRH